MQQIGQRYKVGTGGALHFQSKDEVLEFLTNVCGMVARQDGEWFSVSGDYRLGHGEYARPEYRPRQYSDGWGIHGQYHFLPTAIPGTRDGRVEAADWFDTEGQFIHPESIPY